MEFLARHYEDILLDYRFIRAIGVQLNLKSEPEELKRCDPLGGTQHRSAFSPPDAF